MLQGSLDNFALDEVLGLLSSTTKTGKLDLKGNRGSGVLRLSNGKLVDATASNTANGVEPEDVLFELLRFGDGTFNFTSSDVEEGNYANEIADVVGSAERRLADWRTIEAVVPSLRHQVGPVPTLTDEEITITRREWMVLMTIAGGCPVSSVCDQLDLGEVEGSRQIKGLAERGLVIIAEPRSGASFNRQGLDALRREPTPPPPAALDTPDEEALVAVVDETPEALSGAKNDRRAQRPPHPSDNGSGGTKSAAATAVIGDAAQEKSDSSSQGGLLMRYLKSDD